MKHCVRKEDVNYIVNPEKKKVVAYIDNTQSMFLNFMRENYPFYVYGPKLEEKLIMPNRFIGISTCGPDDVWNEEIGRLIAFDRMKDNLNKSFFKRANTFVSEMEKALDRFCDDTNAYGQKLEINTDRRKKLIAKILGDEVAED